MGGGAEKAVGQSFPPTFDMWNAAVHAEYNGVALSIKYLYTYHSLFKDEK